MNCTEGNLGRGLQSKQPRAKEVLSRQKEHFAKVRAGMLGAAAKKKPVSLSPSRAKPSPKSRLAQEASSPVQSRLLRGKARPRPPSQPQVPPAKAPVIGIVRPDRDASLTASRFFGPLPKTSKEKDEAIDTEKKRMPPPMSSRFFESLAKKPSERDESVNAKKKLILMKKDWVGTSAPTQKPIQIEFAGPMSDRQRWSKTRRPAIHRIIQRDNRGRIGKMRGGNARNLYPTITDRHDIRIKIGSQDKYLDESSSAVKSREQCRAPSAERLDRRAPVPSSIARPREQRRVPSTGRSGSCASVLSSSAVPPRKTLLPQARSKHVSDSDSTVAQAGGSLAYVPNPRKPDNEPRRKSHRASYTTPDSTRGSTMERIAIRRRISRSQGKSEDIDESSLLRSVGVADSPIVISSSSSRLQSSSPVAPVLAAPDHPNSRKADSSEASEHVQRQQSPESRRSAPAEGHANHGQIMAGIWGLESGSETETGVDGMLSKSKRALDEDNKVSSTKAGPVHQAFKKFTDKDGGPAPIVEWSAAPKSRPQTDQEKAGWAIFVLGNGDIDDIKEAAFKEANHKAAQMLKPRKEPTEVESTVLNSLAVTASSGGETYMLSASSAPPSSAAISASYGATVGSLATSDSGPYGCNVTAQPLSTGSRTVITRSTDVETSCCPGDNVSTASDTMQNFTETSSSSSVSMQAQPARSQVETRDTRDAKDNVKFARPKLFVGKLSSSSKPNEAVNPVRLGAPPRGIPRKRTRCGRAGIRALPNYDGDPIEDIADEDSRAKGLFGPLEME